MTHGYDDDDARRYDDPRDDWDGQIEYSDICPRCFELWRDCVCDPAADDADDSDDDNGQT